MTTLRTDIVRALAGLLPAQKKEPWEMTYKEFAEITEARKEHPLWNDGKPLWVVKYNHESWYAASFIVHYVRTEWQAKQKAYYGTIWMARDKKRNVPQFAIEEANRLRKEHEERQYKYLAKLEASYDKKYPKKQQ